MELEIREISKHYKDKKAVDNVSLTLTPGVWGLLGANGAGKTSLMRMIAGIVKPTSGEILYDGLPIWTLKEKYREIFGYLPQEFGFYPEFTVKSYLEYVASLKGLSRTTTRKKIGELLERLTLSDVKNKKIRKYSGGMKQRLGIAQAMINNPEILILDEPTVGLDPKERVKFRKLISSFASEKIVLLSTHIVSDIEAIADEVFLMKKGTFILQGSIEELVSYAQGKVWELTVPEHELKKWELKYTVANLHHSNREDVTLRIISNECPSLEAVPCRATLEDLYLSFFPTEDGGAE